jgi:DNA-binding MarR family transcriptional regulator
MVAESPLDFAESGLREIILAGENYRRVVANYLGLTISESQAVSYLFSRGAMGQRELGEALGFNTSSTTALVDRLERNSIAERVPDPTDRRRSTVQLTRPGRKAVAAATGWIVHAFDNIDPARLPELAVTLHTLADDLRARTALIPANTAEGAKAAPRRRR